MLEFMQQYKEIIQLIVFLKVKLESLGTSLALLVSQGPKVFLDYQVSQCLIS